MAGTKAGFGFELLAAEAVSLLGGFETGVRTQRDEMTCGFFAMVMEKLGPDARLLAKQYILHQPPFVNQRIMSACYSRD